jgi:hypothetical protein
MRHLPPVPGIIARLFLLFLVPAVPLPLSAGSVHDEYRRRVEAVKQVPGFVALWDFVHREDGPGGKGRFVAHTAPDDPRRYPLEARNIIRDFWGRGREATYQDFPLAGRGPFGQAVLFRREKEDDFLPVLLVPRSELHDSPLDVKGPGASVSMVVWVAHQEGDHVLAGIWHEGTDITPTDDRAAVVQAGRRQYALFAGLAANPGAPAAHVSENGGSSFGDKYARNLAVTRERMPVASAGEDGEEWSVAGFVFDNAADALTAYLNGRSEENWIEDPATHPFFRWPAHGWTQAQLAKLPGVQEGELPDYPRDRYYEPPETRLVEERVESESMTSRVVLKHFEFTKVRETYVAQTGGGWQLANRELVALKVNPYWFGHDLYAPPGAKDGAPFSIGRVIKSSRSPGNTAAYGGVAVFRRALSPDLMRGLAQIGRGAGRPTSSRLHLLDLNRVPSGRN